MVWDRFQALREICLDIAGLVHLKVVWEDEINDFKNGGGVCLQK
jgi:hypothetical protein